MTGKFQLLADFFQFLNSLFLGFVLGPDFRAVRHGVAGFGVLNQNMTRLDLWFAVLGLMGQRCSGDLAARNGSLILRCVLTQQGRLLLNLLLLLLDKSCALLLLLG